MLTPRDHLSFSQMTLFERSPELYKRQYIYGQKPRESINMQYGSQLANGLEHDETTGDPILDLMMCHLPKYELMDIPFEVGLPDGKEIITILAKPDSMKADCSAFYEYKCSTRKWTQKIVDDSDQLTFYAMAMWLKTHKIPQEIELCVVEVEYIGTRGKLRPTGQIKRFKTKRTMLDIIKMTSRAKKAWKGIKELCEKELLLTKITTKFL